MSTRIKISLSLAIALLVLIWLFAPEREDSLTSNLFCAHGRVFIEFNHDGFLWGTTFLDRQGKPVPCTERTKLPISVNTEQLI